jgi:uncharacterized protein
MTLAIGGVGGWLFWAINSPLPWMIGSMTLVTALAVSGLPVQSYRPLRNVMVAVLGVMLGSSFTPDLVASAGQWPVTLAVMAVSSGIALAAGIVYFQKVAGADLTTAYFSAAPGGLNEMSIAGTALGGDERTIALSQATRILILVFVVPFYFRFFAADYVATARTAVDVRFAGVPIDELGKLIACGIVGAFVGRWLRLPAAAMLGPMMVSAAAHFFGFTSARPPVELVSAAQVVMGVGIGSRFAGAHHRLVLRLMGHGAVFAIFLVLLAVACAWTAHAITGISTSALTLAYAPGGVAEMSLVALALSVDVAFVATHHAARMFLVVLVAQPLFRLVRRLRGT